MKRSQRKPQINFEAKQEFIDELKRVADVLEVSVSQIARESIREKLDKIKRTDPRFNHALAQVITNA